MNIGQSWDIEVCELVVVFGLIDKIINFEHFDQYLYMRSFGPDDSWDKLLELGWVRGLLKFSLFRGGSSIFSSRLSGGLVF